MNGVRLADWQSSKKTITKKLTKNDKKTMFGRKKKKDITVPPSEQIVKYLVRKKEQGEENKEGMRKKTNVEDMIKKHENITKKETEAAEKILKGKKKEDESQDLVKTTFGTKKDEILVKENIRMFQDLAKGEECIIRSGRCSKHNMKLEKRVTEKRVSVIDELRRVKWQMREAVNFACPSKPRNLNENSALAMLSEPLSKGTNGRAKKLKGMRDDQCHAQDQKFRVEEDLQLDC